MPQPGTAHAHLFLLPGFDPHGSRTLLRLLQRELAQVNPRLRLQRLGRSESVSHWQIATSSGQPLRRLSLLGWNDLVRRRWSRSPWRLLAQGLQLYGAYLCQPSTWQALLDLPRPAVTLLWPLLFWLVIGLPAALSLALVAWQPWPLASRALLGAALLLGWVWLGLRQAEIRRVGWLFRALHFSAGLRHGEDHDLRERLDRFADQLLAQVRASGGAPITLVAHSTGCYLAMLLVQRLLESGIERDWPGALTLVTLGHNPAVLVRFHPRSATSRAIRSVLASGLPWLDLTCRDDWMSFAEVDLCRLLGGAPAAGLQCRQLPLARAAGLGGGRAAVLTHQFVLHFQYFRHGLGSGFSVLEWLLPERHD